MALSESIMNLVNETFRSGAKVSRISPDLRGKTIVIYGGNNVGKTTQAANFTNPIFMPFEKGMNAISGAIVLQNTNWTDAKRNIKKLSGKKWKRLLGAGEQITVVWDGFERAGFYCQKYIEEKYNAFDVADARGGFGAWKQYEKEFWTEVDKLLSLGYTVVFIGHADISKKKGDKFYPKGDERCVAPIVDNADFVYYIESNGTDDKGNEIKSSAYLSETDEYFARCRFPYVKRELEEFTAEEIEKSICEGIQKQIEVEGLEAATYEEQQEIYQGDELDYDELIDDIRDSYDKLKELDELEFYAETVAEHLGEGVSVSEASKKQLQPLVCIKEALEEKLEELEESGD